MLLKLLIPLALAAAVVVAGGHRAGDGTSARKPAPTRSLQLHR